MYNRIVKTTFIGLFTTLSVISCFTKKGIDLDTLPKDISEKPLDETVQKFQLGVLEQLETDIEKEISKEICKSSADWAISPLGSKPCGGPEKYIAYPKNKAVLLLPKIEAYTHKMQEYNTKFQISSDCVMPEEPKAIVCKEGVAEFIY